MEVRANYVMVGAITLGLLLSAVLFTMWIAKQNKGTPMAQYNIHMKESVAGLSVNNPVLFTGVRVGAVTHITISETEPGAVVVRVSIAADTPVRADSEASLAMQGITGVSIVSISGGTADSPLMSIPEGTVGTIGFKPSPLASVMQNIPETISSVNRVLARMEGVFSDENVRSLTVTLDSMARITSSLADKVDTLDSILEDAGKASDNMAAFSAKAKSMVAGLEPGIKQFSQEGLADLRMLMLEARNLVQSLTRVTRQLGNDPRRFLFGDQVKEYKN